MKNRGLLNWVITFVVAVVASLAVWALMPTRHGTTGSSPPGDVDKVFRRVIQSGTIRAGYVLYPPGCIKDANSGKLSGVHVEALEKAASALGLKVEWAEELGWGSMVEAVRTGRVDMIGSPVWSNSTRSKVANFTDPLFFSGVCAYVRADDHRFDGKLRELDKAGMKIATIDGEMSDIIARQDFSNAERVSLPQNSDNSVMLENVRTNRADVTFVEPYIAQLFLKSHPGSLRNITPDAPIRVFANTMLLPLREPSLKSMLDTALAELRNSGEVERLLEKYSPDRGAFFPVAKPYRTEVPAKQ